MLYHNLYLFTTSLKLLGERVWVEALCVCVWVCVCVCVF